VKEILFVDAVSGTPLRRGEKDMRHRPFGECWRSSLVMLIGALVALIILLVTWAFS
jgi:hypothetical protein